MNEKQMMLSKIKKYDFTLKELNLYLDTHPDCRRGLAMFAKYSQLRKNCVEEYTAKYGPLTPDVNNDPQHWSWVDGKWPWERRD